MQPTADFNPSKQARLLLRRSRQGALATLMAGSGDPYCSLVNVASQPDGAPIRHDHKPERATDSFRHGPQHSKLPFDVRGGA